MRWRLGGDLREEDTFFLREIQVDDGEFSWWSLKEVDVIVGRRGEDIHAWFNLFVRILMLVPSRWRFFSCGAVFLICL